MRNLPSLGRAHRLLSARFPTRLVVGDIRAATSDWEDLQAGAGVRPRKVRA